VDHSPRLPTKIAHLARRQHGHVARRQLVAAGVSPSLIDRRLATGDLIAVHHGVYAVAYRRDEPLALAAAAVLACGPRAVLSHDSAAALWGLRRWPKRPEVIAPRIRRPGIRAHRSITLTAAEVTVERGLRVTTAARTLIDIRRRLSERRFTRLVNDARLGRLLDVPTAERLLGEAGCGGPTRSELEDAVARLIGDHGLPAPQRNVEVDGVEVDVWFPDPQVIVEVDGWDTHRDRATFESDRERDAMHAAAGRLTVRITAERLLERRREEARRLHVILAGRTPAR
jgi:very-short-patch-repair endonuclease